MNTSAFNAFRLDLPGHGDSDKPAQPLSMQLYVESTLALMDALEIERAAVVGHSMGAGVALQMALDYPERSLGAVCVNGAADMRLHPAMLRAVPGEIRRGVDDMIALIAPWLVDTSDPDNERSYIQFFRMNPRVLLRDYWLCHTFDIQPLLPEIEPPILVVGADHDYVYSFEYNQQSFERAQQVTMVCIPDEGHFVPGERPGKLTQEIAGWLSRVVMQKTLAD